MTDQTGPHRHHTSPDGTASAASAKSYADGAVEVERHGPILRVWLNRPTQHNPLNTAVLDAIAHQVRDVVEAMDADLGTPLRGLRIDGGGAGDLVCGLVADQLGRSIERPLVRETTALGAAALAGLAVGFWGSPAEIGTLRRVERRFEPSADEAVRAASRRAWARAVERSRGWAAAD